MAFKRQLIGSGAAALILATGMAIVPSLSPVAQAAISVYRYDALGRLRKSCSAIANQAYRTDYALDPSDNRSAYSNIRTDYLMLVNSALYSPDGRFYLAMQSDGNLVLYQANPVTPLWATNTGGSGSVVAGMQGDGNLVLYRSDGVSTWASNTSTHHCSKMELQNDGNLVITNMDNVVVWASNTGGR